MNSKFHTLYRITNLINGKYYKGAHSTDHPLDEYLGSGKLIGLAVEKYDQENFIKKIFFNFDTRDEMFAAEKTFVTLKDIESQDCYNLKAGGFGGWPRVRRPPSEETKKKMSESKKKEKNHFFGKHHSEEAKKKIRQAASKFMTEYYNGPDGEKHRHENSLAQIKSYAGPNGVARHRKRSESQSKINVKRYSGSVGAETRLKQGELMRKTMQNYYNGEDGNKHCRQCSEIMVEYFNGPDGDEHRRQRSESQNKIMMEYFNGPNGKENRQKRREATLKRYSGPRGEEERRKTGRATTKNNIERYNGPNGEENRRKARIAKGLTDEKVAARRCDIEFSAQKYGWKSKLAGQWGVTPAAVCHFIKGYALDLISRKTGLEVSLDITN